MNKKEYFTLLLRRDFLRYLLLQHPAFSTEETVRRLKSRVFIDKIYHSLMDRLEAHLSEYFSPALIRSEQGEPLEILPANLTPDYAGDVADDFIKTVEEYTAVDLVPEITAHIERLTWLQGLDGMERDLRIFLNVMRQTAEKLRATDNICAPDDLQQKYEAAKRRTLGEQMMHSNNIDIAEYFETLTDYCRRLCESAISQKTAKLYQDLADSDIIKNIADKFGEMARTAAEDLRKCDEVPTDAGLDSEYAAAMPMDFYRRNVEDITPRAAFRMFLLQLFARNEDTLRSLGTLSPDGRLTLFTGPATPAAVLTAVNPF